MTIKECRVFLDGVFHVFGLRHEADKFIESFPADKRNKCVKMYHYNEIF